MALYYVRENGTIVKDAPFDAVIVSPSLYWYAHAELPTSSLSKAKKLADTLLASRPASYTSIYVENRGGGFDCYAYDEAALSKSLPGDIQSNTPRYFLQQFSDQMPLRIDENLTAETINGICIETHDDSKSLPSLDSIDIRSLAKPFNASGPNTVSPWMAAALIVTLFTAVAADLALRYQTLDALRQKSSAQSSQKTMYEIKALLKKYRKIDSEQRRLRAAIKKALDSNMKSLECDPKKGCTYE